MQINMLSKLKLRWIKKKLDGFYTAFKALGVVFVVEERWRMWVISYFRAIVFCLKNHYDLQDTRLRRWLDWLLRNCQQTVYCFHRCWPNPKVAPGNQEAAQPNCCACLQLLTIQVYIWCMSENNKIGTSVTASVLELVVVVLEERRHPYLILRPPLFTKRLFFTCL